MEKKSINKKRRKDDESFKAEFLRMVKSSRSVAEVSRTMGIGENLIYNWKNELNTRFNPS
jgi:transposase